MSAWSLRGLRVDFGTTTAVREVDLTVQPGERVGLVGRSGSGKTTLVRAGLGLTPRTSGSIALFGEDTRGWSTRHWQSARRRAQLLFQDPGAMLHPQIPIGLLLEESARIHRPEADPREEAARALATVGLAGRQGALRRELSGGEQRRAGLARVLLAQPMLLVADEPTVGLDAALKADLLERLLDGVPSDCAVVLIAHDLRTVAWACDRLVVMDHGEVVERLPATALGAATAVARTEVTRALLHAAGWRLDPTGAA